MRLAGALAAAFFGAADADAVFLTGAAFFGAGAGAAFFARVLAIWGPPWLA